MPSRTKYSPSLHKRAYYIGISTIVSTSKTKTVPRPKNNVRSTSTLLERQVYLSAGVATAFVAAVRTQLEPKRTNCCPSPSCMGDRLVCNEAFGINEYLQLYLYETPRANTGLRKQALDENAENNPRIIQYTMREKTRGRTYPDSKLAR